MIIIYCLPISMVFVLVAHVKHSLFHFHLYMIGLPGLTRRCNFDFCKVFDSVPYKRSLYKLDHYGIRGNWLKWFSSFLLSRNQRVLLSGSNSSWNSVASGVLQGTVLGPLLFLLYSNDITHTIPSAIHLFADDCILYRRIKSGNDRTVLQQDIHALSL